MKMSILPDILKLLQINRINDYVYLRTFEIKFVSKFLLIACTSGDITRVADHMTKQEVTHRASAAAKLFNIGCSTWLFMTFKSHARLLRFISCSLLCRQAHYVYVFLCLFYENAMSLYVSCNCLNGEKNITS